ncbi:MAG TPA: Lon family ATP-dependent protease [Clostridia bacterium]|nr:Lon family ATP-dependent protease [Clostridia bacterium]
MKTFLEKFKNGTITGIKDNISPQEQELKLQVTALYGLLSNIYGSDKIVLRAGKLKALQLMRSKCVGERVLALQRIVYEDPTLEKEPELQEIPGILGEIENEIADVLARRLVEDQIEKKINERLQQRHDEYIQEVKMQIIKENTGVENAQTLKRLAILEKLDSKKLSKSAIEILRPQKIEEIIGQEEAVKALLSKLASPFPQHVILYGPPGVGKTTAARLALEVARGIKGTPFDQEAPFIEVNGSTLRWDPREVTNPLLGSVHDPIYQGARRDLAETGIPEPKLGLVTDAHGGVLFIDEIGEIDPLLQNKFLKVLEDKKVFFDSAYYDPSDPNVPKYIEKIFKEGAPADFILIGATTRDPEEINPALRSRCAEVYFDPLTPVNIEEIVLQASHKLDVELDENVPEIISEYTMEGRKTVNILYDAYGLAFYNQQDNKDKDKIYITNDHVYEVIHASRLTPHNTVKGSPVREIGKVLGLGVIGFLGSVLEIEAVVFPARSNGQGNIRFNDTAGSMAKDSVFNAASVIRKLTGEDLLNYDVHVNVVGGGRIDGPSAGTAISLAIISALQERPFPQDVAVTGELSIQGKIRAVGGIYEKLFGAKQAGIKKVFVPTENAPDLPTDLKGINVITVQTIDEIVASVFSS